MKLRLCLLSVSLILIANSARFALAEEPYLEFLQGLRERNYFDYALIYLDQLAQRPSLPDAMKPVILYEKAITLRDNARVLRNPEKQSEQLDQALAFLEQFVSEYPTHPSAADANFDRAQILLQKATVEITQSKSPSNKGSKNEFQQRGRDQIQKAREVLQLAHDQHEAAVKAFPAFIDEQKDPKLHAEREKVERNLVIEATDLARCMYQEAQTYDPAARQFKQYLTQAAEDFEKVYLPHRKQVGGQLARAWQGKCYEEQGDLQKALGIYNELLEQPEDDPSFQTLKSQTLLFKLICLHARDEDQLVVDLSDEWLKKNASESKTSIGLGIQWEQALAYESLGENKNLPPDDQRRYFRQARAVALNVSKFTSEYKDFAVAMTQRMTGKLGGKERKPEDFETAYAAASSSYKQSRDIKKELDSATKNKRSLDDITRLKQDWSNELNEAARNFELSMALVNRRDNPKDISNARYFLALTNFDLKRYYEAAILGQFVARTTADDENNMALDAAYVSMVAFQQAYYENKAEPAQKKDDMKLVIKAANFITEHWPDSDKSNEAKLTLGRMYRSANNPSEAAEWFSKIPESDPKFAEAQLEAGQAYWFAYGSASRLTPDVRPSPEKLAEWKAAAEKHLRTGIDKLSATLPKEGAVPQEMANSKIHLASILLNQGKGADAVKILLDDPQSIVKAVAVPDEANRPSSGMQSRALAMTVYKLLLLSYISQGAEKLNNARDTMKTLEAIAAGDPNADLTDLYVGLGRGLKAELEQFRSNGETERFNKQMEAFELFLDDMFKKQEGMTLGSLTWIGETYMTLGEISPDRSKSATFYDRASSAFNRIVSRSQNEASFIGPDQLLNVKVRLVHCNRLKKDFQGSEQMLTEVLKARGNDLKTQIEGASVYQDWGTSGDYKKFEFANGGKKDIGLWGWVGIAKRIQQQKNFAERPEMVDVFLDARYSASLCLFRYAKEINPKDKATALNNCAKQIIGTASIFKTIPDEKRAKLNELYRDVLQEAGKPVTNLPRFDDPQFEEPVAKPNSEPEMEDGVEKPAEAKKAGQEEELPPVPPTENNLLTNILVVLALLGGAGFVARVVMKSKKVKPRKKVEGESTVAPLPKPGFTGIAADKSPKGPATTFTMPTSAPKPRPKPKAAPGSASAERPASKTAARPEGTAPPPKPRPRPPAPPSGE